MKVKSIKAKQRQWMGQATSPAQDDKQA